MLSLREDVDYRIIYMEERKMHERLRDVYIAKSTTLKPPVFHELLEELVDIEAALFVMHNREVFTELNDAEVKQLLRDVENEHPEAIATVIARMDLRFVEMFAKDLLLMLLSHQFSFFEKDPWSQFHVTMHNETIQAVW